LSPAQATGSAPVNDFSRSYRLIGSLPLAEVGVQTISNNKKIAKTAAKYYMHVHYFAGFLRRCRGHTAKRWRQVPTALTGAIPMDLPI
jgi:hypothetical protein